MSVSQKDKMSPPAVNAAAFSPNGQFLAGADADGAVRLWKVEALLAGEDKGRLLEGHSASVNDVAFSPNNAICNMHGAPVRCLTLCRVHENAAAVRLDELGCGPTWAATFALRCPGGFGARQSARASAGGRPQYSAADAGWRSEIVESNNGVNAKLT